SGTVVLYEGSTLVAQQAFANLAPGQQVQVAYERPWDTTWLIVPTYTVSIVYPVGNPDQPIGWDSLDCDLYNNGLGRWSGRLSKLLADYPLYATVVTGQTKAAPRAAAPPAAPAPTGTAAGTDPTRAAAAALLGDGDGHHLLATDLAANLARHLVR